MARFKVRAWFDDQDCGHVNDDWWELADSGETECGNPQREREDCELETRIMQEKLVALRAENERLECCGNCKWFRAEEYQNCGHRDVPTYEQGEYYISAPDKCDFAPSRWEARP